MNSTQFMHDFTMKVLRSDFEKGLDIGFVGELAIKYLALGYLTQEDIEEVNKWYEEKPEPTPEPEPEPTPEPELEDKVVEESQPVEQPVEENYKIDE